jgi:serine/threonine-protein kinase
VEQILKSRYRTAEKISETPFSLTYRGFLIGTEKPVIIKIYKRGTLNSTLINHMKRRVREFSLLTHHGLARLLDGDYGWQGFYYVREYIEGMSLADLIKKEGKIDAERAAAVGDQVLSILEEVHAREIIHGALKPTNIFIDQQGLVKLTDFIIEGEVKNALPLKVQEMTLDAQYAAPEEAMGCPATVSSDLYALGLILFEMVSGKKLFPEGGLKANLNKLRSYLPLPSEELSLFPRYLREIISKALQKDPLMRFASAAEFKESLKRKGIFKKELGDEEDLHIFESLVPFYAEEVKTEKEAVESLGRWRWSKEKHRNWLLAIILALAVVVGILYAFLFGR